MPAETNVYRLAEVSNNIIDQCVAQRCSFSPANTAVHWTTVLSVVLQVSRTFYAKGSNRTAALLLGAYSALSRQVNVAGTVKLYTRYEMEDVVLIDGRARGIVAKEPRYR